MNRLVLATTAAALLVAPPFATAADAPARTEADILKSVKLPEGYEATVFALPPAGGYPTQVSAAIDGTIFVAIDENGSLGRDRNPNPALGVTGPKDGRKPGRVVRMRDTNGDGRADEFKTFAEMESPRGVIWDGNGMGADGKMPGTLYVMYPPKLTAFTDTDGDGAADQQEDILTGLGFDLGFRGADHTTNGMRLAIDGFIYIAVGDYGFTKAVAKDGTTLSMRGGGIVRIRPDGTGFEIVSRGQRNIYDVAVSPTLDLFTRDNTNDGGGWNVRLSHVPPGAHMGYPTLFINFPEDIVEPLADLGGGSPCGALWLDEPGLPKGLFTVEWGANAIMFHDDLVPDGAGWKLRETPAATTDPDSKHKRPPVKQNKWISLTRPTDMDVDAFGALFITSWEGATFNYNGPNAGYVLRVREKTMAPFEMGDFGKASVEVSVGNLTSTSAVVRLATQRELLRRQLSGANAISLEQLVIPLHALANSKESASTQTAALYAALQMNARPWVMLHPMLEAPETREAAIRAIGDYPKAHGDFDIKLVTSALNDASPRVRAAAITALRRLGKTDAAPSILPLVADPDPVISHLAVRALSELKAAQPLLAALDSSDETLKPGALRALYGIHTAEVVEGLIARLPAAKGELRKGILNALCRLANVDAPYLDPKEWWGTRPDTSGPVYKPVPWGETEKIVAALKRDLDAAKGEDARWLVQRMYLCKINTPGLVEQMLAACGDDTVARLKAIEGLFRADNSLPQEGLKALSEVATNSAETPDHRAQALRLLQRASERSDALEAVVAAYAPLAVGTIGQPALSAAFEDFTRDSKQTKHIGAWSKLAAGSDPAKRALAQTVLVNLATSALVKGKDREQAEKAVAKNWESPETAASLLGVIARTKAKTYAAQVDARLKDPNNAVAEAALFAHQALGLGGSGAPMKPIGELKYEDVFAAVAKGGDAAQGKEIYLRAGCIACHTIDANEPPKGPILSAVAKMYDRAAMTESILKPNAKLAQGFESTWIKTKKGEQLEGFVTREGGDNLDLRNVAGQTVLVEKGDIAERGHREQSMMPEGLMNAFSPADLANLLAFLDSLKK